VSRLQRPASRADQDQAAAGPGPVGWRAAGRELLVAAGLTIALTGAAAALGGGPAVAVTLIVLAAVSLVVLAIVIWPGEQATGPVGASHVVPAGTFARFWRMQVDLLDATRSLAAWYLGPRRSLQSVLAARLSERHGISLADDAAAARALLLGPDGPDGPATRRDRTDLWHWIDPARPAPEDASDLPGIPPRALATLIERLEQL
jgi:hypothetical protein